MGLRQQTLHYQQKDIVKNDHVASTGDTYKLNVSRTYICLLQWRFAFIPKIGSDSFVLSLLKPTFSLSLSTFVISFLADNPASSEWRLQRGILLNYSFSTLNIDIGAASS